MTEIIHTLVSKPGDFFGSAFELRQNADAPIIPEDMTATLIVGPQRANLPTRRDGTIAVAIQISANAGNWIDAVRFDGATRLLVPSFLTEEALALLDSIEGAKGSKHTVSTWWRGKYVAAGTFDNLSLVVGLASDGSRGGWALR